MKIEDVIAILDDEGYTKSAKAVQDMQEKVEVYESLLHSMQACMVSGNKNRLENILLGAIWDWSYAHRSGNGELSDEEQAERVEKAFLEIKKVVGV